MNANVISAAPIGAARSTTHPSVSVFASVLGIAGLGLAWRAAARVLHVPGAIAEWILAVGAASFVILGVMYAMKIIRAAPLVRAEYTDAATSSYFGTITISISLLAAAAVPYSVALATVLWIVGVVSGVGLLLALIGTWIAQPTPMVKITPACYIPVVGVATTVNAGVALGHPQAAWATFAIAVVFWLTLQPLVFYRLIFAEPLPPRAAPTLGVLVSSPAVLASSSFDLTGGGGPVFVSLLFAAMFLAALIVRLWGMTKGMSFSITAWGYTFPVAALAGALIRYHKDAQGTLSLELAVAGLTVATAIVGYVAARSLWNLVRSAPAEQTRP